MIKTILRFLAFAALLELSASTTAATLISIQVSPINPAVPLLNTRQLTAIGTHDDASHQDITASVTWSSSNPLVASVSNAVGSKGQITGLLPGTATMTATLGDIFGTTAVTVTTAVLISIDVSPPDPTLIQGDHLQFTATGIYSDGTTADLTIMATWTSSTLPVATISIGGLATGIGQGPTTITAYVGLISGSTTMIVVPPLASVHVDDGLSYAEYGKTVEYIVTVHNDIGVLAIPLTVTGTFSPGFDVANAHWQCISIAGAPCSSSGVGALIDNVTLDLGASALWQITVPILINAPGDSVQFDVIGTGTLPSSDVDTLVIFRDGFD
jgi:Bacterial Ig-like domain (group 2)